MRALEKRLIQSSAWEWFASRVVLPWAVAPAGLEEGGRLLDIGSGGGASAERLLLRHPDLHVVATDFDADMVARARGRSRTRRTASASSWGSGSCITWGGCGRALA